MGSPTLQRPLKVGSVRTYVDEVNALAPADAPILAPEVDADLDTLYNAWNDGASAFPPTGPVPAGDLAGSTYPSPVIAAKAITDAKVNDVAWGKITGAPTAFPPWTTTATTVTPLDTTKAIAVAPSAGSKIGLIIGAATVKGRLRDVTSAGTQLLTNTDGSSVLDDSSKPSWFLQLNPSNDVLDVYRAPAGSTTFALMSRQAADGLYVPGNVTVGYNATGAPRLNVGQRTAWESWDGNIAAYYVNDSSTIGYNASLMGWKLAFDYRAGGSFAVQYRPVSGAFGTIFTMDTGGSLTITGAYGNKSSGTLWTNPSDRRLKRDVADYATGLDAIRQLRPVSFKYNGKGGSRDDGRLCYGLVADDVLPVMPEMVGTTKGKLNPADEAETDILSLDASNVIWALVNAVKELAARVAAVEAQA